MSVQDSSCYVDRGLVPCSRREHILVQGLAEIEEVGISYVTNFIRETKRTKSWIRQWTWVVLCLISLGIVWGADGSGLIGLATPNTSCFIIAQTRILR